MSPASRSPGGAPGATRKRRVLQVIDSLNVGGAERVVLHLARELDADRFDVAVCLTKFPGSLAGEAADAGVPVFNAFAPPGLLRYTVPLRLLSTVRRFRPDVVHSHGAPAMLHTGAVAVMRQLPAWVHTFHFGNYPHLPPRVLKSERWFAPYVRQLVAVSETQRQAIAACHGLEAASISVVGNGVDARPPVPRDVIAARRAEMFGVAEDDFLVGCVAVLTEQKGITYLLDAIANLRKTYGRMRFAVIGGGPLESALREQARTLGLDDVVTFTGWRTDALDLMPMLDVFVMPSLWEAMPMVLLEAMASERAIVVSDVGDNARIVEHERSALVIPSKDASAIETAVSRLVSSAVLRRDLAVSARRRFDERFTVDRMVAAYDQLYLSL